MEVFSLPETVSGLFFDIDGTLYNHREYEEHQYAVLYDALALSIGRPVDSLRLEIETWRADQTPKPSLGTAFARWGAEIPLSVTWRSRYITPEDYLHHDPQLRKTLDSLLIGPADGPARVMVAVTNNPSDVGWRTLRCLGVEDCFSAVVGLDSAGGSKPDSRHFDIALELAGVEPAEGLSVGDRYEIDIVPALKRGMGGVLVGSMEDVYTLSDLLSGMRAACDGP